ncbi:MAG TPA: PilZ domain-containing protein [Novosphingobium sp.]|nr:PilZ domain-containing protein [Novosphingobium sp.]
MSDPNQRQHPRDSLFLLAPFEWARETTPRQVKVRNLSASGLMVEAELRPAPVAGDVVSLELRNIGKVSGVVAWAQGNRFGVALDQEIDPQKVRMTPAQDDPGDRAYYQRGPLGVLNRPDETVSHRLRKI